jgi:hypothetical protein
MGVLCIAFCASLVMRPLASPVTCTVTSLQLAVVSLDLTRGMLVNACCITVLTHIHVATWCVDTWTQNNLSKMLRFWHDCIHMLGFAIQ